VTAPEKRLDEAVLGLTARERAVLILRPWLAGGEGDQRLRKNMPAAQQAEVERIEEAINDYNQNLHSGLAFVVEWLWQEEVRLAWLECLDGFLNREAARSSREPKLPTLPPPRRGFKRELPLVYGQRAAEEDDPLPADWHKAREQLIDDLRQAVQLRWGEYVAWRLVQEELRRELGEEMVHAEPRELMGVIGQKVTELKDAVEHLAGPIELPHPSEEHLATARSFVNWAALKPPPPPPGQTNGRPWMPPAELAELEALEARLAAELRATED
jgi:hypothetical protein